MLFGRPVIRPTELATLVAQTLIPMAKKLRRLALRKGISEEDIRMRALRTKAVKIVLRRKGKKLGLQTFPDNDKRLGKPRGEWLFDLVWWDDRPNRKRIVMAMESEWTTDVNGIVHDFEKLLSVKSPLKLMIYKVRPKTARAVREKIQTYLQEYTQHVRGERYIFCEFQSGWHCSAYLFHVKDAPRGRVKEITFRSLCKC
jgi:hypothetical protein